MSKRPVSTVFLSLLAVGCAGGSSALEYGVPATSDVRYIYADTSSVGINVMGQSLEMTQRGVAEYAVSFRPAPAGVNVTMSVIDLEATLSQPMGAPVRVDEGDVEGSLVFALDRFGNSVVSEQPRVEVTASQMVSGLALAHNFFPGLPGRAAAVGDGWVDTVSYEGREGDGRRSERSILRYTVVGDTVVGGRSVTKLSFEGTSESTAELQVSGMSVSQQSEIDVEGYVLWDANAGLMIERWSSGTGAGTASVPIAPNPLPIQVRTTQWVKLQGN